MLSAKFSPTGGKLASAANDRHICTLFIHSNGSYSLYFAAVVLWNVYGDCENYAVMKGHTGAIMEIQYSTDGT